MAHLLYEIRGKHSQPADHCLAEDLLSIPFVSLAIRLKSVAANFTYRVIADEVKQFHALPVFMHS
jgi:hypothetical protein